MPLVSWGFGFLALFSGAVAAWQFYVARRFPLYKRLQSSSAPPALTIFKPLQGMDPETPACLESWFQQEYPAPLQLLFGVSHPQDPVVEVVRKLQAQYPEIDSELRICPDLPGANRKVCLLMGMESEAKHELWVIGDADVRIPRMYLEQFVIPFNDAKVGSASAIYRYARTPNIAMATEAVCVNADFWSQVLQARSLGNRGFALGAVLGFRRADLIAQGGFGSLVNHLAEDYQIGQKMRRIGKQNALCTVPVDCLEPQRTWLTVWQHQLRWSRTIRSCQPVPFALSLLHNPTLWPLLWMGTTPHPIVVGLGILLLGGRLIQARQLQSKLLGQPPPLQELYLPWIKDLLTVLLWLGAFTGNRVVWQKQTLRLLRNGQLQSLKAP